MRNCLLAFALILLSLTGYGQCTMSVNISTSNPSICSGNAVTLTANISGGTGPFTFVWNTGEGSQSINVNKEGNYKVTVIDKTPGCSGVSANINVAVSPTPPAPSSPPKLTCFNTSATLIATGAPDGATYEWYDSQNGGNFLQSGSTYVTPAITSGIIFYVQTTLNGCSSLRTGVFVSPVAGPTAKDVTICYGNTATLQASGGDTYEWYDSPNGGSPIGTGPIFNTPPLTATTTYYVVSTFQGCVSGRTPVKANVTPAPQLPVAASTTVCTGGTVTLHANPGPGIFAWYDVPTGGTALIYSPDYTTPPLTRTTTYYVENAINDCVSGRTAVLVTVTAIPAPPGNQVQSTCMGSSIFLTASAAPPPGYVYTWYNLPVDGAPLQTGNTFQTPVLNSTTTYYVEVANGACPSARSAVKVLINPPPAPPSVTGGIICNGSTITLTPTGPGGGTYQWYDVSTGGTPIFTGPSSFTTPPLTANTQYYVETLVGGCSSTRTTVNVTVNPVVNPPAVTAGSACFGSGATLTASGGDTYKWYDSATSTTPLASGQAYTTPPLTANTTYYVETTVNGCTSARAQVVATVNAIPPNPAVDPGPAICPGSNATLTASAPSGTLEWYDAPTGGSPVNVGATFNPVLQKSKDYYVQNVVGDCISGRTQVRAVVASPFRPQFKYPIGSVCKNSGTTVTPVINNPSGGTFTSTPSGLTIDATTGVITVSSSNVGEYFIKFIGNGSCAVSERISFKVYDATDATFSYNANYCQDEPNPLPTLGPTASAGTFSATPAGLVFVNTSTGEIDLANSVPQTYTITNNIAATSNCSADSKTAVITINPAVAISAGPGQTVGIGSQVQLAGNVTGATGTWSGGSGNFSDPNSPNAVYTPTPGETSATLTFTSGDPAGSCGPKSAQMVITFVNTLAAPTVTGNSTCVGSSANLTAIAPGGTYKWYDVSSGGTPVFTGANFQTGVLTTNVTYYVEAVNSAGIASPRTAVVVNVNSIPVAPVVPSPPVCAGNQAMLTPNDQTGTFEWFDVSSGGNPIANTAVFTSPVLTSNQTYYVEQTVNGCTGPRTRVDVTVSTPPNITSAANDLICSGNALNYAITADNPAATFLYSRAAVAGISNPAVTGQSATAITETLINTSAAAAIVTYVITPYIGTCPGPDFNYSVIVYPTPQLTSSLTPPPICNKSPVNYNITFNTPADFTWKRDAVPGIQNAAVSGQATAIIREALINNTNAPIEVTYVVSSSTGTCTGADAVVKITVNPSVEVNSPNPITACSGQPLNYQIAANIPGATYNWSRAAVLGMDNPAVDNQNASLITEVLKNTTTVPVTVVYKITPIANGCTGDTFFLVVVVNPQPAKPIANSNSPICVGSTIQLRTPDVANATFKWTGPNGYSNLTQNPDITNATLANIGDYSLTVTVNDCSSEVSTASVVVRTPGKADAGPDKIVCITDPEIILDGSIIGGAGTGVWSVAGTGGTFSSLTDLKAHYTPSAADRTAGAVTFTLTTTSDDNCAISTDDVTVHFGPLPAVNAGEDQGVCVQTTSVQLHGAPVLAGTLAYWTSSGSGTFSSPTDYNATYSPSSADVAAGLINLVLHVTNPGPCQVETDTMTVKFIPPAEVHAEKIRYVLKDRTITLHPNVSEANVTYLWTPNVDIDDNTLKNPTITGVADRTYKVTVTDSRGCISEDSTIVKVSPKVVIPNTFTPNNDGVNDLWNIQGLIAYTDATVDIFTRYGQKVYHSVGYDKPWDGLYNGKELPTGVYYYVIDTKLFNQVLSGNVTLLR